MSANPVAELEKLAYQLSVDVDELEFLAAIPASDLRALRSQIGEALFQADKHHFVKVAALSKSIPTALAAKVTEFALPPLIAARTAELLEPAKAVDLVGRISDGYLAKVASLMDPHRSANVIEAIPTDKVAMVARQLAASGQWVVIGGFVSVVTSEGVRASVAEFDGEQLLRIGFVLDDTSRLGEIATMLTDQQLAEILEAAREHDLWAELDELIANVDGSSLERIVELLATADAATRASLVQAAATGRLSAASATKLGVSQ